MKPFSAIVFCAWVILIGAPAQAQQLSGCEFSKQWTIERIANNHWKLSGAVEVQCGEGKFYADHVEFFTDTNRLLASGNVVFISGGNRIASDNMEFDTQKQTGVFYNAAGTASLGDKVERSMFGSQEPDAYFYGEKLEKLGEKKYRITRGGFTTCVQPKPRWEITSGTLILNLDDYAIVRNSLLKVKGVPIFYMPLFYYPIQDDDRATGFLMPTYGNSTVRGQTISNAFFWAISRSQDATIFHDWYTKTGNGIGTEYRYLLNRSSEGSIEYYFLNEQATTYENEDGSTTTSPGRRNYEFRSGVSHRFPGNVRARGRIDYFSNVTIRQIYEQNLYDASQRTRYFSGNISGSPFNIISINGTYDRRQVFFGDKNSTLHGSTPRITFNRPARQLFGSPIYFGVTGELANRVYQNITDDVVTRDRGLRRVDFSPQIRAPLTKWQFLTINASAAWHGTHYSHSLNDRRQQVEVPLFRQYYEMGADIVGPVLTRVFNTPDSGYAEKLKHVIEPSVRIQRVSDIENRDRIVLLSDSGDYVVGNTTRVTYGIVNRLMAKTREASDTPGVGGREILSVAINQSYYSDPQASQYDDQYSTSFRGREPSKFSPVSFGVRATPTDRISGTLRMEYDPDISAFQSFSAQSDIGLGNWLQTSVGWSVRKLGGSQLDLDPVQNDNYINSSTSLKNSSNTIGGTFNFNYDVGRDTLLQHRIIGYYNAQCCGFAVEYQAYNFPDAERFRVPQDRRFNVSVTLAGVGTFSNLLGAFGGTPQP